MHARGIAPVRKTMALVAVVTPDTPEYKRHVKAIAKAIRDSGIVPNTSDPDNEKTLLELMELEDNGDGTESCLNKTLVKYSPQPGLRKKISSRNLLHEFGA